MLTVTLRYGGVLVVAVFLPVHTVALVPIPAWYGLSGLPGVLFSTGVSVRCPPHWGVYAGDAFVLEVDTHTRTNNSNTGSYMRRYN
jgi:hypothetical protein